MPWCSTRVTQPNQPLRKLRLFDSFEGLPEITSKVDLEFAAREIGNLVQGWLPDSQRG